MSRCTASLDAYNTVHTCRRDTGHTGAHTCGCGVCWTTA